MAQHSKTTNKKIEKTNSYTVHLQNENSFHPEMASVTAEQSVQEEQQDSIEELFENIISYVNIISYMKEEKVLAGDAQILFKYHFWSSHEPLVGCCGTTDLYVASWYDEKKNKLRISSAVDYDVSSGIFFTHKELLDMWKTSDVDLLKWIGDRETENPKFVYM